MNSKAKSVSPQRRVLNALQVGGRLSAADLSRITGTSDPRSHIRDLRGKGVDIRDEWRPNVGRGRHKVYFIPTEAEAEKGGAK